MGLMPLQAADVVIASSVSYQPNVAGSERLAGYQYRPLLYVARKDDVAA